MRASSRAKKRNGDTLCSSTAGAKTSLPTVPIFDLRQLASNTSHAHTSSTNGPNSSVLADFPPHQEWSTNAHTPPTNGPNSSFWPIFHLAKNDDRTSIFFSADTARSATSWARWPRGEPCETRSALPYIELSAAQCSPSQVAIVLARDADDRADSWAEVLYQIGRKKTRQQGEAVGVTTTAWERRLGCISCHCCTVVVVANCVF